MPPKKRRTSEPPATATTPSVSPTPSPFSTSFYHSLLQFTTPISRCTTPHSFSTGFDDDDSNSDEDAGFQAEGRGPPTPLTLYRQGLREIDKFYGADPAPAPAAQQERHRNRETAARLVREAQHVPGMDGGVKRALEGARKMLEAPDPSAPHCKDEGHDGSDEAKNAGGKKGSGRTKSKKKKIEPVGEGPVTRKKIRESLARDKECTMRDLRERIDKARVPAVEGREAVIAAGNGGSSDDEGFCRFVERGLGGEEVVRKMKKGV